MSEYRAWIEAARPYLAKEHIINLEKKAPETLPTLKVFEDFYPAIESGQNGSQPKLRSPENEASNVSGRLLKSCSLMTSTDMTASFSSSLLSGCPVTEITNPVLQKKLLKQMSNDAVEDKTALPQTSQVDATPPPEEMKEEEEADIWHFPGFKIHKKVKTSSDTSKSETTPKAPNSDSKTTEQASSSGVETNMVPSSLHSTSNDREYIRQLLLKPRIRR